MFFNYLKLTIRNLIKQKGYAVISVLGLTIGIAAFILIYLYINHELSYDKSFSDAERIYRVTETLDMNGQKDPFAPTSINVAGALERNFPEVEKATKLFFAQMQTLRKGDKIINFNNFYYADTNFFEVFDFKFVYGSPEKAMDGPHMMVLKKETADRFFPDQNPVGETLKVNSVNYKITGVIASKSSPVHFDFNGLKSLATFSKEQIHPFERDWFRICCHTYFKAKQPLNLSSFQEKVDDWTHKTLDPWIEQADVNASVAFHVQPLTQVHFDITHIYDHDTNTNAKYIYIFGFVAIFVILIAAINHVNIATARSIRRAKEVGIRKVSGAGRRQLFIQFLLESFLITLVALLLSLVVAEMALSAFNRITGKEFSIFNALSGAGSLSFIATLISIWILTALLSGIYPAAILSGFRPIDALKGAVGYSGKSGSKLSTANFRKVLVVFQFAISIAMIFATLVIFNQIHFMQKKDLNFDEENLLVINDSRQSPVIKKMDVFRQELLKIPEVKEVAAATSYPGYNHGRLLFYIDKDGETIQKTMTLAMVDHHYADLLGLQVVDGRFFSKEYTNDATESFVMNEAAVDFLNLERGVGQDMMCGLGVDGEVIGVVNDYNYASLHKEVEPLVMILDPQRSYRIGIRVSEKSPEVLSKIESVWYKYDQNHPFIYEYLGKKLDTLYSREEKMLTLFMYFSGLILFIACMGLFALAAYTAEQKTKENGVRKVLGGSVAHIVRLQLNETSRLVLLAGIIATPLTWYFMNRWLQDFAYSISIGWIYFAIGILSALLIAVLTVVYIAWRSARLNPVDALRYE